MNKYSPLIVYNVLYISLSLVLCSFSMIHLDVVLLSLSLASPSLYLCPFLSVLYFCLYFPPLCPTPHPLPIPSLLPCLGFMNFLNWYVLQFLENSHHLQASHYATQIKFLFSWVFCDWFLVEHLYGNWVMDWSWECRKDL